MALCLAFIISFLSDFCMIFLSYFPFPSSDFCPILSYLSDFLSYLPFPSSCCSLSGFHHVFSSFLANQGVKQGCILSPTLFNIYLADLQAKVETSECDPVHIKEGSSMGCLIWADDLLLLSKSKNGLDNMLSALKDFS